MCSPVLILFALFLLLFLVTWLFSSQELIIPLIPSTPSDSGGFRLGLRLSFFEFDRARKQASASTVPNQLRNL